MFRALIKNGMLSFGDRQKVKFLEFMAANEGRTVAIELEKRTRSLSQNAFYWVYLGVIARETGNDAEDLHELFKRQFLPPVFKTIMGKEVRLPGSTADLDKAHFGVKRRRRIDQDRRRRVDHPLGCEVAAPRLEARSAA